MNSGLRAASAMAARLLAGALALAALVGPQASAQAQSWPSRPIRLVLPFPPGGPSDILARTASEKMLPVLGQPIVIENRPGAGGNIGMAEVAHAAPDGYSWVLIPDTVATVNPSVYRNPGFKVDDLVAVSYATSFNQVLVCNPSLGVKTLGELMALARTRPLNYASGGAGVPGHLAMELLLSMAGVSMTHVPYKGPAPAMQDVIAGQVPCGFLAGPTVLPQVRAGRLVALAVSGGKRSTLAPEIPTVAQAGFPGYDATFSLVLLAPRGTPASVVNAFQKAFADAMHSPELVAKMATSDQEVIASSPDEAAQRLAADARKWGAVVQRVGLHLD